MAAKKNDPDVRRLRVVDGIPASLSDREARAISREISALNVPPIPASRLQQLWAGSSPTRNEAAALDSWRDFAERDIRRMQTQIDRLAPWTRRAIWANLIVWPAVVGLYIATHLDAIGAQLWPGH